MGKKKHFADEKKPRKEHFRRKRIARFMRTAAFAANATHAPTDKIILHGHQPLGVHRKLKCIKYQMPGVGGESPAQRPPWTCIVVIQLPWLTFIC